MRNGTANIWNNAEWHKKTPDFRDRKSGVLAIHLFSCCFLNSPAALFQRFFGLAERKTGSVALDRQHTSVRYSLQGVLISGNDDDFDELVIGDFAGVLDALDCSVLLGCFCNGVFQLLDVLLRELGKIQSTGLGNLCDDITLSIEGHFNVCDVLILHHSQCVLYFLTAAGCQCEHENERHYSCN